VHKLLPLADFLLMPSEMESFGLAALEAMACRVPAIATRVGGVAELIDNGENGLLFDVGEVDEMAAGILELVNHRTRFEQMRQAARMTAQKRFCAKDIVKKYVQYYERILSAN
jgi:glycosyltransferase involved in cell wall biosynthesis